LQKTHMAKLKRSRSNKSAAKVSHAAGRKKGRSARKKRPARAASKKAMKVATRAKSATVKAAAKRVLASAGRTAKALAISGAVRARSEGRKLMTRGARSAAVGVQKGARAAGTLASSTLASIADRVESEDP
jgi:hypothetical protein